jgi:uncharacterized protein (TIGR02145 family)
MEWMKLRDELGGEYKAGKKMKSNIGWGGKYNGTNSSGFAGLPGGACYKDGELMDGDELGYWWSSTEVNNTSAWSFCLFFSPDDFSRYETGKETGMSFRCIKN